MNSSSRRLLQAGLGGLCACVMAAAQAVAPRSPPPPTAASIDAVAPHLGRDVAHVQQRVLDAAERPPLPTTRVHLRIDYDQPARMLAKAGMATCDAATFANASGTALVAAVTAATVDCINSLFSVSASVGAQVFPEAKMVTIANAMAAGAAAYPGNNSTSMLQLVVYLRAGYYVQWYNPDEVGDYGPALTAAIRPALDGFVANAHFQDVSDSHGAVLAEFVTLIDSAGENAHQIGTIRGILSRYGPSHQSYGYMQAAVNNVFTVLFRGHYLDDFRAAVQTAPDSGLLDTLADFVTSNKAADVGTDREYLLQNAAGELARFLNPGPWYGYPSAFHASVHPKAKAVLDQFALTGAGSGIYVRMAGVIDYYDHVHCSYFGLCSFADDLEEVVLPPANARDCSPTLRVRSQALNAAQLDWVCARVGGEESYFHTQAQTGNVPVADDYNTKLEMVIFHSSTDYETYSGTIFGNDTNNGGIYLEGNPSDPANQPRFLAYEAEWLRPTFDVWNLTHEYIHYLDGRFNWYGGFGDYPLDAPNAAVWFIEGFAEYMSYSYRDLVYGSAVGEAANPDKFTLAQLFDTEYSTDYARTYQWGYLAVRFMFERHRDDISALFGVTRPGTYVPGYGNWLTPLRSSYNAEFRAWVACFAAGNGNTAACGGTSPQVDAIFANGFDGAMPVELPECAQAADGRLDNGCRISGLAAAREVDRVWLTILVPAGKSSLTFTMSGGSGDADIYEKAGGWPDATSHDHASTLPGNDETITVSSPAAGWHYLMLKPKSTSFAGVTVAAAWQ